jgi:hypothetical protein
MGRLVRRFNRWLTPAAAAEGVRGPTAIPNLLGEVERTTEAQKDTEPAERPPTES